MGRKPINSVPMTAAERQAKRREKIDAERWQFNKIFMIAEIALNQCKAASINLTANNKDEAQAQIRHAANNLQDIIKIIRTKTDVIL